MLRFAFLSLISVALLAGCFGDDAPAAKDADPAPTPASDAQEPAVTTPAPTTRPTPTTPSPTQNVTAPTNDAEDTEPERAPEPTPVAMQVPVGLAGTIGAEANACVVAASQCASTGEINASRRFEQDVRHGITAYALTLNWTAQTPLTETLRLGVTRSRDGETIRMYVEGASPLTLAGTDITAEPGDTFVVWVDVLPLANDPAILRASAPQPFTINGTLGVFDLPSA